VHLIPESEILRYSRPPSPSTISAVAKFQDDIRSALGDEFETFLQGSYKKDTSTKDINDVDIVAIRKTTVSSVFSKETYSTIVSWNDIFVSTANKLAGLRKFSGNISFGDKCIVVRSDLNADVVPAVRISNVSSDPIAIYSLREGKERLNFPRVHYENGVAKNKATAGTYKPIVRMFKRWATNHWPNKPVAPSFYIECLVHSVPNDKFSNDLAAAFFPVGYYIETSVLPMPLPVVYSVAGDKDILTEQEWKREQYAKFHAQLVNSTSLVVAGLQAKTQADAIRYWRAAFNE
jgi:hypothetical protein